MPLNCAFNKRCRRGFSLVELAIVLAVAGTVLGGIWAATNAVQEGSRRTDIVNQIHVLVPSVRDYYAGRALPTATTNVTHELIEKGIIPSDMVLRPAVAPYQAVHAFGPSGGAGSVIVWIINPSKNIQIDLRGIKRRNCPALVSKLTRPGGPSALLGINVGNVGAPVAVAFPVSVDAVLAQCITDAANGSGQNLIRLTYRLRAM